MLRVVVGVFRPSPVTGRDVEKAVGAEVNVAAVVVRFALLEIEDRGRASRVGHVGVSGRHLVPLDAGAVGIVTRVVGVVDVEQPVVFEVGVKRQSEQALFVAPVVHDRREIEKGRGERLSVGDHPDRTALFDHEEPPRPVAGVANGNRSGESVLEQHEGEIGRRIGGDGDCRHEKTPGDCPHDRTQKA